MITSRKKEILFFICILIPILIFSPYLIKRSKSIFYRYKKSKLITNLEKEKNPKKKPERLGELFLNLLHTQKIATVIQL